MPPTMLKPAITECVVAKALSPITPHKPTPVTYTFQEPDFKAGKRFLAAQYINAIIISTVLIWCITLGAAQGVFSAIILDFVGDNHAHSVKNFAQWVGYGGIIFLLWRMTLVPYLEFRHHGFVKHPDSLYVRYGSYTMNHILLELNDLHWATARYTIGDLLTGNKRISIRSASQLQNVTISTSNKDLAERIIADINAATNIPKPDKPPLDNPQEATLVKAPWAWIRYAPLTLSGCYFLIASILFIFIEFPNDNSIGKMITSSTLKIGQRYGYAGVMAMLIIDGLILGLLASALYYIIIYCNFVVTQTGPEQFTTSRGIIPRRRTFHRKDIVATEVRRNLLLRLAGATKVSVKTHATHPITVLPPAPEYAAATVTAYIGGEDVDIFYRDLFSPPPVALIRRYCKILPISLPLALWWAVIIFNTSTPGNFLWPILLIVASISLARDRYHNIGYGFTSHHLVIQEGSIATYRTAIDRRFIQGWHYRQTPPQRLAHVCSTTTLTRAKTKQYHMVDIDVDDIMVTIAHCSPHLANYIIKCDHA